MFTNETSTLKCDDYLKTINLLSNIPSLPHVYYSPNCVIHKTVKRTWKERLFTFPWNPWLATKICFEPTIYKIGNDFVAHTSYKNKMEEYL